MANNLDGLTSTFQKDDALNLTLIFAINVVNNFKYEKKSIYF